MNKPFNLEEAKAGKPFVRRREPNQPCCFIGIRKNGSIVYEYVRPNGVGEISWAPTSTLEMIPEKKTITVYLKRYKGKKEVFISTSDICSNVYEIFGEHTFEYEE